MFSLLMATLPLNDRKDITENSILLVSIIVTKTKTWKKIRRLLILYQTPTPILLSSSLMVPSPISLGCSILAITTVMIRAIARIRCVYLKTRQKTAQRKGDMITYPAWSVILQLSPPSSTSKLRKPYRQVGQFSLLLNLLRTGRRKPRTSVSTHSTSRTHSGSSNSWPRMK